MSGTRYSTRIFRRRDDRPAYGASVYDVQAV
jgi:hypothetical protein